MNRGFSLLCKCITDKDDCVSIGNRKLPVCSRCLGFYIGLFISIMLLLVVDYAPKPEQSLFFIGLGFLFALPTVTQGVSRRYYGKGKGGKNEIITFIFGLLVSFGAYLFALGLIPYLR